MTAEPNRTAAATADTTDTDTDRRDLFAGAMRRAGRPTGPLLGTIVAIALFASVTGAAILIVSIPALAASGQAITTMLLFLPVWVLLWLWMRVKEQRPFASIGFREPRRAPVQVLRGFAIAIGAMAIPVAVAVLTGNMTFLHTPDGGLVSWPALGWVLLALVSFVVQGGAEELITRGYLLQAWAARFGILAAMIAQTAFFTLSHSFNAGLNGLSVVSLVLVSVLLGFWALSEGGLWGVIAFHATWNWAQGSVFGVAVSGIPAEHSLLAVAETTDADPLVSGGVFGLEASITTVVMLAILAAAVVVFWARTRPTRTR